MFVFFLLFAKNVYCEEQAKTDEENTENDKSLLDPPVLSDFITARQSRNLTIKGQKEVEPIVGRYFRKPLVNLLQGVQPSILNLRRLFFTNFDGMILKGESNCLAKFPDIMIVDCTFKAANQHPIHINGPSYKDFEPDAAPGNVKE